VCARYGAFVYPSTAGAVLRRQRRKRYGRRHPGVCARYRGRFCTPNIAEAAPGRWPAAAPGGEKEALWEELGVCARYGAVSVPK